MYSTCGWPHTNVCEPHCLSSISFTAAQMLEFGADAELTAAFARKINDRFVALNSKFCMDIVNCIPL